VTPDQRVAWLRFAALNETARLKNRMLDAHGDPVAVFEAPGTAWSEWRQGQALAERLQLGARRDVARELDLLDALGITLLTRGAPNYPPLLASIDDPPPLLFVRGELRAASLPCVALVGTRHTSPYGELVAEQLARDLADAGVAVISGMAQGVDTAAHEGALQAGGHTAAVLGTGVDRPYPASSKALYQRLCESGAVVSEFCLGTTPQAWHFPVRNRIISGLCRGVVVVQAPSKSGALITAQLAMEQNREVMAVPGNITEGRQSGCHELIRDGAALVRGVDDILAALRLPSGPGGQAAATAAPPPTLDGDEGVVAGALGLTPSSIDDLIEKTGLATPSVQAALVTLELKGVARRLPGNQFVRVT